MKNSFSFINPRESERIDRFQRISTRLLFVYIALYNFWKLDVIYNWSSVHFNGFSYADGVYLFLNVLLSIALFSVLANIRFKTLSTLPKEKALSTVKKLIVLYSTMITVFIAMLLYNLSIISGVAGYVVFVLPVLGAKYSGFVATIGSWLVSGIVGNFAYDVLKKKML
jgi:hypothetical protein